MENNEKTQATLRKRKLLLAMPALVLPFLTMGFWALGGGSGTGADKKTEASGLNPSLPDARLKEEKSAGKLSFYDQAAKDSLKLAEWMRSDPYYRAQPKGEVPLGLQAGTTTAPAAPALNPSPFEGHRSSPEEQIMEKLARLQKELDAPPSPEAPGRQKAAAAERNHELSREVDRLQHLMEGMKRTSAEDPGMEQLESVMDKILDIQHPQRVRRRLEEVPAAPKEAVHALSSASAPSTVSLFPASRQPDGSRSGFFSAGREQEGEHTAAATQAVVHESQVLTDGSVVKLRLTADIQAGDAHIPKGTLVYGRASFGKERLYIHIQSLRLGNALYPVALDVYDLDGMAGLSIPATLTRDVVGASAERSLAGLELSALDPSLSARAAATGLSAAKNLLSRKVRQVSVTLKAGYRVLLRDKTTKH